MARKNFELELFIGNHCPYCHKVLSFMEKKGIEDVTIYNISEDPAASERLVKVGGKKQIPCLFIDGKPMYESNDIIKFLNDNLKEIEEGNDE